MHKVEAILNNVGAKLGSLKSIGVISELLSSRVQAPESYPTIIYRMGSDEIINRKLSAISDSALSIYIDIYVESTQLNLDMKVLNIREEVEKVMLSDHTLGLPFVLNTEFLSQEEPDYLGQAATYSGAVRLNYRVTYRTPTNNPSYA